MLSLILATQSQTRIQLLENAGLTFATEKAEVDERSIEQPLLEADFNPADIAAVLAEAKAMDVSSRHNDCLVIGADQTLSAIIDNELCRLHKPENMEEARRQLLKLRANTHTLHSAVCCVKNGEVMFRHQCEAHLTFRDFTPEFVGRYLSKVGDTALTSVGCYRLEGPGIQLFEKIDGDYFTILGLPLLPLLAFLRSVGELDQ